MVSPASLHVAKIFSWDHVRNKKKSKKEKDQKIRDKNEQAKWFFVYDCTSPSATTQDNLDDKLRKFEIRDMMGLTDDRDISETVSETWSTDVLGSDFDPNMDDDRLQEIAGATLFFVIFVEQKQINEHTQPIYFLYRLSVFRDVVKCPHLVVFG